MWKSSPFYCWIVSTVSAFVINFPVGDPFTVFFALLKGYVQEDAWTTCGRGISTAHSDHYFLDFIPISERRRKYVLLRQKFCILNVNVRSALLIFPDFRQGVLFVNNPAASEGKLSPPWLWISRFVKVTPCSLSWRVTWNDTIRKGEKILPNKINHLMLSELGDAYINARSSILSIPPCYMAGRTGFTFLKGGMRFVCCSHW